MPKRKEDMTEEELKQIINSKMVQKYLAYRDLTNGIEELKTDDVLYDQLVKGIVNRVHLKEKSVEKVLDAFVAEIETNTTAIQPVEEGEKDAEMRP